MLLRVLLLVTGISGFAPKALAAIEEVSNERQSLTMSVGRFYFGHLTITDIMGNISRVLMGSAYFVTASIFIAGAFFYISSAGAEDRKGFGKGMMIGAVIGTAVIAGAQGIMNAVLYFVYGP